MKYQVTFGDYSEILNAEQLKSFIEIAVIKNKDISEFSVIRVK